MTTKKLLLWLSIATAIGTILGVVGKMAYDRGCEVQKVEQVSAATSELYVDVKEIKKDVNDLKTDAAVTKEKVSNIEKGIANIEQWIRPKQITEVYTNAVQVK